MIRSSTSITNSSGESLTIPSSTVIGDLMLVMGNAVGVDISTPAGWTLLDNISADSGVIINYQRVWYRYAVSGDPGGSVTLGLDGTGYGGMVLIVLDGAWGIEASGHATAISVTNLVAPNVTTTKTANMIYFASKSRDTSGTSQSISGTAGYDLESVPSSPVGNRIFAYLTPEQFGTGSVGNKTLTAAGTGPACVTTVAVTGPTGGTPAVPTTGQTWPR